MLVFYISFKHYSQEKGNGLCCYSLKISSGHTVNVSAEGLVSSDLAIDIH